MLWLFLFGLVFIVVGMIIAIKHRNKKIIVILTMCVVLLLIGFVLLLPGLLFAFSNWEF